MKTIFASHHASYSINGGKISPVLQIARDIIVMNLPNQLVPCIGDAVGFFLVAISFGFCKLIPRAKHNSQVIVALGQILERMLTQEKRCEQICFSTDERAVISSSKQCFPSAQVSNEVCNGV